MIIKCKMCGGDLNIKEGKPICECEFCGTQQTIPQVDDEKKASLFNRANKLRMNADYDKAASIYASITAEYPEEAEAYWGLCLCKYGIEYVEDPATGKKKPTCHRTLTESIMDDTDFDQACENADPVAMRLYREEAKEIDRLQKAILEIVAKEEPYDVFICYKETNENGERTEDSVLAQEIHDSLTGKGLKVFFSRISLEDKLGQQYEPYIYAALHSSKVMLAIGTKFEYYNAVWVKNEWTRFLDMMKTDKEKALIPCYKNLDAYDMPKEFKNLQAQDMAKLGWLQDLTRGIEKLVCKEALQDKVIDQDTKQIRTSIKRARLFLESSEWEKAIEYCEKILDIDPENSQAYMARELAERQCSNISELAFFYYLHKPSESASLSNARRFADSETQSQIAELEQRILTAPDDAKRRFAEELKQKQASPEWQAKKERIDYVRTRAKILSKRIWNTLGHTVILDTAGKIHCTKVVNDRFGTYDDGIETCGNWSARLRGFCVDRYILYGNEINGKVIKTECNKDFFKSAFGNDWRNIWEEISTWKNVKRIITDEGLLFGIMEDGTVKSSGNLYKNVEYHGQDKVEHLTNVSQFITVIQGRTLFLGNDGTIKSSEYLGEKTNHDVWDELKTWTNIKDAYLIYGRIVGQHFDGTNIMTKYFGNGDDETGGIEAETWTGIICYSAGRGRTIGLTETGEVLVTDYYGKNDEDPNDREAYLAMRKWKNIAYLLIRVSRILGVTADGKVKSVLFTRDGLCEDNGEDNKIIPLWEKIVALEFGYYTIFGIKRDGSIVTAGKSNCGDTDVSSFRMFNDYDKIPEEISEGIIAARAEQEREIRRQKELQEEAKRREEQRILAEKKQREEKKVEYEELLKKNQIRTENLTNELANLKGLFSGKRRKEIQEELKKIHQHNVMLENSIKKLEG